MQTRFDFIPLLLAQCFGVDPSNLLFMLSDNKPVWNDYLLSQNIKYWASLNGEGRKILTALFEISQTREFKPPKMQVELYFFPKFIEHTNTFRPDSFLKGIWANLASSSNLTSNKIKNEFFKPWNKETLELFDDFFRRLLHLAKAPQEILLDELLKTVLLDVQPYFQNWILVAANSKDPFHATTPSGHITFSNT